MGNKKFKVTCDAGCGKRFHPKMKEDPCQDGVKQYFTCPHCGKVYNVCKITKRGLELQGKIRAATGKGDAMTVINLRKKMRADVTKI